MAQLTQSFKAAATHVQREISGKLSENQLLTLYGLYKQAVSGNCPYPRPEEQDAGIMAKWKVWNDVKGLTKQQAAVQYIATVMSYDPSWSPPGTAITPTGTTTTSSTQDSRPSVEASFQNSISASTAHGRKGSAKRGSHARALADITGVEDAPASTSAVVAEVQATPVISPSASNNINSSNHNDIPTSQPYITSSPKSPSSTSSQPPQSPTVVPDDAQVKFIAEGKFEGILYKQRDVFKGWRPRYFKLEDQVLYYYVNRNDPTPRGTMFMENCTIDAAADSKTVQGVKAAPGSASVKYYALVISHPSTSNVYNLSATSLATRDKWIQILREAAIPSSVSSHQQDSNDQASERSVSMSEDVINLETNASSSSNDAYSKNVPESRWKAMELTIANFIIACNIDPDSSESTWNKFGEKVGIKGYSKPGKFITVRGNGIINHDATSVFKLIWDPSAKGNYDTQLNVCQRPAVFNDFTVIDHLVLKGVWPTYPRDFLSLIHWRLVDDAIYLVVVGYPPEELPSETVAAYPKTLPQDGYVRGNCIMAGWRMKALPNNQTEVIYIVQSDIGGKVPASLVNQAAQQQAFMIAAVSQELSKNRYDSVPLTSEALSAVAKEINKRTGPTSQPTTATSSSSSSSSTTTSTTTSVVQSSSSVVNKSDMTPASKVSFQPTPPPLSTLPSPVRGGRGNLSMQTLVMLLLPSLIWFVFKCFGSGFLYSVRGAAFGMVLAFLLNRLIYEQLGSPLPKRCVESEWGGAKGGVSLFRFPIELKKLLRYLENKRQRSGVEINVTHVTIKAAAIALKEHPALNGHICLNNFHRNPDRPAVAYLSPCAGESLSATLVNNADLKAVNTVATELRVGVERSMTGSEPFSQRRKEILNKLPSFLIPFIERFFGFLGSQLGLNLPQFGIKRFPLGNCVVVTPPSEGSVEMEVDVTNGIGSHSLSPIVITVGGIRVQSGYMKDKQMAARPVLHMSASIDLRCASLYEAKNFVERIQQLMRDPSLID